MVETEDENDVWREKLETMLKLPKGRMSDFFHQYGMEPVTYRGKVYFCQLVGTNPNGSTRVRGHSPCAGLIRRSKRNRRNFMRKIFFFTSLGMFLFSYFLVNSGTLFSQTPTFGPVFSPNDYRKGYPSTNSC